MAAQANITVFDGAATPVTHTLIGEGIERLADGTLKASWKESLAGVPDYAQIRVTATKRKLKSGVFRVAFRVEVPVMESISGQNLSGYTAPPKVAYVDTTELVGYYHERSVVTGRRLSRQLAVNLGGNISTTVTPVATGPLPELFDQLIQVT
jgi:hypothetical protein